ALVQKTFDNGRNLYDSGKPAEAIKEWQDMLPYLQNEESMKTTLLGLSAAHENLAEAQRAAQKAESEKDMKLPTPEEFSKLLTDSSRQLDTLTEAAKSRRAKAE